MLLLVLQGQLDLIGVCICLQGASVLLLVLQSQLKLFRACLCSLQVPGPAGSDWSLPVLAGSDSAAAGAAGPVGAAPPVARPPGRGGGAGVASRYVNTMPTSQLQGGGIRSARDLSQGAVAPA